MNHLTIAEQPPAERLFELTLSHGVVDEDTGEVLIRRQLNRVIGIAGRIDCRRLA